jgi:alkylated DNA nucleotide flippase Atl1
VGEINVRIATEGKRVGYGDFAAVIGLNEAPGHVQDAVCVAPQADLAEFFVVESSIG